MCFQYTDVWFFGLRQMNDYRDGHSRPTRREVPV